MPEEEHVYYGKAQTFLLKNTDVKRREEHENHASRLRLRFTRRDNVDLFFWKYELDVITTRVYHFNNMSP